MKNQQMMKIAAIVVVLVLVAGAAYYLGKSQAPPQSPEVVTVAEEPAGEVATEAPDKIQHPVPSDPEDPAEAAIKPVTKVEDVASRLLENWKVFFGTESGAQFIISANFVHRFVLMIENATESKIPTTASIFEPVAGEFLIKTENEKTVLNEANYHRYDEYIALLKTANLKRIVSFYVKVYPLLQAVNKEMGTDAYLNDRVVAVLDRVIHASALKGEVVLVPTYGRYAFESEDLEELSAVEKVLIRVGPGHAAIVKEKAKELRALIASQGRQ